MNTEENGVSIQEMTCDCDQRDHVLDQLCPDCAEQKEARDANIAHQIVDESEDYIIIGCGVRKRTVAYGGAVSEYNPMSVIRDLPSGHDWTDREDEFLDPISLIADRLYDLETSLTVTANETVCDSCHYIHNSAIHCPNCN